MEAIINYPSSFSNFKYPPKPSKYLHPIESTHFIVQSTSDIDKLYTFLVQCKMIFMEHDDSDFQNLSPSQPKTNVLYGKIFIYPNALLTIFINIFKENNDCLLVEVQRMYGNAFAFHQFYKTIQNFMEKDMNPSIPLAYITDSLYMFSPVIFESLTYLVDKINETRDIYVQRDMAEALSALCEMKRRNLSSFSREELDAINKFSCCDDEEMKLLFESAKMYINNENENLPHHMNV